MTDANLDTANAWIALYNNVSGDHNTATGVSALGNNTTGSNNIALGQNAGSGEDGNANEQQLDSG
jgi:hypothetical protein